VTTYFDFTPTNSGPFQFSPTLDGQVYTVIVTWNVEGQRYYINIYTLTSTLVVCKSLVASPQNYDISLTWGYFTSTLVFREASQQFEVNP